MARRHKFRKKSNLTARLLSAGILVPLSLGLIYMGPPISLILGGLVILFLLGEWIHLCLQNPFSFWKKSLFVLFGTLYLGIATYWLFLTLTFEDGWKFIFWLLFLVWSTDSAAYLGGRLLGGPKLAPSISPKKTWSGFMSGMVGGTIIGYMAALWLLPDTFSFFAVVLFVLIAQGGDLLESQVKRWSHVKDSSPLIPGHGGFLDRLDSLLAVSFILALWQLVTFS